jgi:ubiquinone/menaquinone biosynthesis C-methylase UbiE
VQVVTQPSTSDVAHFDKWAATYDGSRIQRYIGQVHLAMLDLLASASPGIAPQAILDVGCGTGRLLRAAGARWPRARLLGVDPAEGMVAQAERLVPDARICAASAEALPLPDASVDLVVSSFSFHHWKDQRRGLQEIARVLRPDGHLCIADITLPRWLAWLLRSRARTPAAMRSLLVSAGLVVSRQVRLLRRCVLVSLGRLPAR